MNEQHLLQLTEQVRNMDEQEQEAVAEGLSPVVMMKALALVFMKQESKLNSIQAAMEV